MMPKLSEEQENDTDNESSIGDIYPEKEESFDYCHDNIVELSVVGVDAENDREVDSVSLFLNRMVYCTFAMCLLWTTSLQISTIIASNYISVPSFSSMFTGCQNAFDEVRNQQSIYESCVDRQSKTCNSEYAIALERETSTAAIVSQQNLAFSQAFTNAQLNCSNAVEQSKSLLSNWLSGGQSYTLPYVSTCDQACVARFEDWLGTTSTTKTNDLYNQIILFNSNSNSRVNSLATYSSSLGAYNSQYVRNKTANLRFSTLHLINSLSVATIPTFTASFAPLTDLEVNIASCLTSVSTNRTCQYGTGLYPWYLRTKANVEGEYQYLLSIIQSVTQDYSTFINEVGTMMNSVQAYFNAVNSVLNWIISTTEFFASSAEFCGRSNPDICSFTSDNFFLVLPGTPRIPTMEVFPFPSDLFAMLQQMSTDITYTISATSTEVVDTAEQWAEDLDIGLQNIDFTPNDYNPPRYEYFTSTSTNTSHGDSSSSSGSVSNGSFNNNSNSLTQVTSQQNEESRSFLTHVESLLFTSKNLSTTSLTNTLTQAANTIQANAVSVSQTLTSAFSTYWTSFDYGSFDMSAVMQQLFTLQGILFLFDYLYRGVSSAKLIARFWSRGAVQLPIIKIRSAHDNNNLNDALDKSGRYLRCFSYFLDILPFIWVQILMSICFVLVIIWTVSTVFVPEYYSYCHACVHHTTNSTFISRTMASAAINYAALDGNGKITANMLAYNGKSQANCASYELQSRATYLDLLAELQQKNATYASHVNTANLIENSVNITMFDAMTTLTCGDYASARSKPQACPAALQYTTAIELSDILGYSSSDSLGGYCDASNLLFNLASIGGDSNNSLLTATTTTVLGSKSPSDGAIMMTNPKAVFSCANLPACQVTCEGPNEELLTIATKHCSCMLEWFWNGHMLQLVLAVSIFVLLNLSRILICGGLTHVFWQYFTPPVFDIQLTGDITGHVDLNDDTKEGTMKEEKGKKTQSKIYNEDTQKEIADMIKKKLRSFVFMGYVKIVVGVAINGLWVWAASAMATNVAYQSV